MRVVQGRPVTVIVLAGYVRLMFPIPRRNAIPILPGALLLAGCSEDKPTKAEKVAAASVPGAPPQGAVDETAKNAPASNVSENNDLIEFSYAYPADAARIPELAKMLDEDRATKHEEDRKSVG